MENTNFNKDQVFINFRGKDERKHFLTHLREKLLDAKVNVFIDEDDTGNPLDNLFEQIRKSKIAIVLFTESYAESEWCLDELVVIKSCIERKILKKTIPIFYKVNACDVEERSGKFGEKFLALQNSLLVKEGDGEEKTNKTRKKRRKTKKTKSANSRVEGWKSASSRIEAWKKALDFVIRMNGLEYENSSEADFVKKIVGKVTENLAKIAAEEGRSFTPEPDKISQAKAANMVVFNLNVSQLNINNSVYSSETLEALFLVGRNFEGHNKSTKFPPYVEEPARCKISEPKGPQEGPHPAYGRRVSFHENGDLLYPLNLEPVVIPNPKQDDEYRSLDNINVIPNPKQDDEYRSLDNINVISNLKQEDECRSLDNLNVIPNPKQDGEYRSLDNINVIPNPKQDDEYRSLDNINIDPTKHKNGCTSCASSMSYYYKSLGYYFKLYFCLASGAGNELEISRNVPFVASNN